MRKKHVSALAAHISRFFPCCLLFHARVTNERQRNECGGKALRTTKKETKQKKNLEQRGEKILGHRRSKQVTEEEEEK